MLQPTRRGSMRIYSCSPMGTRLGEPMTASFRPFPNGHAMACSSLPPYSPTVCMTSSEQSLREAAIYVLFPPLSFKKKLILWVLYSTFWSYPNTPQLLLDLSPSITSLPTQLWFPFPQTQTKPLVQFMLLTQCCMCSIFRKVVHPPGAITLQRTDHPSPKS